MQIFGHVPSRDVWESLASISGGGGTTKWLVPSVCRYTPKPTLASNEMHRSVQILRDCISAVALHFAMDVVVVFFHLVKSNNQTKRNEKVIITKDGSIR